MATAWRAADLLAAIIESSVDGIISENLDGVVTSWNRGAELMFGYTAAEMIGRPISVIIPAGTGNEILGVLQSIRQGRAIEQYRTARCAKNGSILSVSITWSPLRDKHGRIFGAVKVVRDVTERELFEEQRLQLLTNERALAIERTLRQTEAELARVARALSVGELAASIAHEINQPLTSVVTNAEAALRWLDHKPPEIEEARGSLLAIARDGMRAGAIVDRVRGLVRKHPQQNLLLDVNEVIDEVVALTTSEINKREITLITQPAAALPQICGDRVQLQQVLLNLIMNGMDAMASNAGPKKLVIRSCNSADGGVSVAVQDCGVGLTPQDLSRIFEPFFTTKPTGIGMGLALSRSIIESHGGRIVARLNDGHSGLTVEFTLPGVNSSPEA